MTNRVYRLAQIANSRDHKGLIPVSTATIWRWVRDGKFPRPFKLGAGTTVWDASRVEEFIAAKRRGV